VHFIGLFLDVSLSLQGSFFGRLMHFLNVIDPRTLFVSEVSKRLLKCKPQLI